MMLQRVRFLKTSLCRLLILGCGLLITIVLAWLVWVRAADFDLRVFSLSAEDVVKFADAWAPWSIIASMALMILHSFLPFPSEVIAIANGMMFGPMVGIAVTWSSAMIGAILSFALARQLGRPILRWVISERHWLAWDGWEPGPGALLIARLIPVISFNLINYAAGLARVRWWPFLWTTGLGILPLTVATSLLGHGLIGASWPVVAGLAIGGLFIALILRRADVRATLIRVLRPSADEPQERPQPRPHRDL